MSDITWTFTGRALDLAYYDAWDSPGFSYGPVTMSGSHVQVAAQPQWNAAVVSFYRADRNLLLSGSPLFDGTQELTASLKFRLAPTVAIRLGFCSYDFHDWAYAEAAPSGDSSGAEHHIEFAGTGGGIQPALAFIAYASNPSTPIFEWYEWVASGPAWLPPGPPAPGPGQPPGLVVVGQQATGHVRA